MNPNQALWEKGDFTRIAASMRESGEEVVAGLGVKAGMKVLDLGCGDGTTALPEARLGADVLGVDIATTLVDAGNRRVQAEGLTNSRFQHGDGTDLKDPADQSIESHVIERFGAAEVPAENISFSRDTPTFKNHLSPPAFVANFKSYYGPTMNAFAAAEQNGKAADLQKELEALFERQNRSEVKGQTAIPTTFLRVIVTR